MYLPIRLPHHLCLQALASHAHNPAPATSSKYCWPGVLASVHIYACVHVHVNLQTPAHAQTCITNAFLFQSHP